MQFRDPRPEFYRCVASSFSFSFSFISEHNSEFNSGLPMLQIIYILNKVDNMCMHFLIEAIQYNKRILMCHTNINKVT